MYTKIKTLNLYISCIQSLYKTKFHMTMNVQEMRNVHRIPILYKTHLDCTKLV